MNLKSHNVFLALVAIIFFFSSCDKEDPKPAIIGFWERSDEDVTQVMEYSMDGHVYFHQENEDGTYSKDIDKSYTYYLREDLLFIVKAAYELQYEYTYQLDGDYLELYHIVGKQTYYYKRVSAPPFK